MDPEPEIILCIPTTQGFDGWSFLLRGRAYELVQRVGIEKADKVLVFVDDACCEGEC